jgi:RNA polymerase sigma-70 factor (ECF subfamily)
MLGVGHDEAKYAALYQRYAGRIYAMALRITGSRADAEDVLQETFLRAWGAAATFRGDSSEGTWLCRIAINRSRDLLRRRPPLRDAEPADPVAPGDPPANRELARALGRLPDGYREVLVMHDVLGMNHAEIAHVLEVDVGTSKSQLHKARARMRELLGGLAAPRMAMGET